MALPITDDQEVRAGVEACGPRATPGCNHRCVTAIRVPRGQRAHLTQSESGCCRDLHRSSGLSLEQERCPSSGTLFDETYRPSVDCVQVRRWSRATHSAIVEVCRWTRCAELAVVTAVLKPGPAPGPNPGARRAFNRACHAHKVEQPWDRAQNLEDDVGR